MSKPIPSTFNPHAKHHFTSGATSPPSAHAYYANDNPYISIPSPHTTSPTWMQSSNGPLTAPHPSSIPSSAQFSPIHTYAPQPRPSSKPAQSSISPPIFTPFRPEKSSPELSDVLSKKRSASAWPPQPIFTQPSANTNIPRKS